MPHHTCETERIIELGKKYFRDEITLKELKEELLLLKNDGQLELPIRNRKNEKCEKT